MDKKYIILTALILAMACSDNQKVEVIDGGDEYIHLGEEMIDPYANPSSNSFWNDFMPIKQILSKEEDELIFSYRLYIGTDGNVEKIFVLSSDNGDVDKYIFERVNDWQFKPFRDNGSAKKYSFDLSFKYAKDENEKYWIIPLNNIQSNSDTEETVYVKVDEMPFPVGGLKSIMEKITYPEEAKREKIEGRVFIRAVINKEGFVTDTELLKGIGGGCNEAALQAVKETRFSPGRKNGVPVNVEVTVPILFRLN
jgi:TonB family protein